MPPENPRIRPIYDLLAENFFVPRYQRGYRWGKQEITELLEDILQYYEATDARKANVGEFYCLQPIVVKKKSWKTESGEDITGWELIDGQQRLTTLLLILSYLEKMRLESYDKKDKVYRIDYETREDSALFFRKNGYKSGGDSSNVDFYHMSKGYEYIRDWFEKKPTKRLSVLKTILDERHNVSVIWYEANTNADPNTEEDNPIDLFTRLNEGKIPLTDAELIKALLLQGDLYPVSEQRFAKQRLFEIASEWDTIEAGLHDDKMWLFLNEVSYKPSSRIELIFRLLADRWNEGGTQKFVKYQITDGKPRHFEYLVFDKYLSHKRDTHKNGANTDGNVLAPVNEIWKEIKDIYGIFTEWYENLALYHYIGYLIAVEERKETLIKDLLCRKEAKTVFLESLKSRAAKAIAIRKKKENGTDPKGLADLEYGEDDTEIRRILLLFNIETLIKHNKETARFPFHLYKTEKITSLEHIHPQNPEDITVEEERSKTWLESHIATFKLLSFPDTEQPKRERKERLISEMQAVLGNFDKDKFKTVRSLAIEFYTELSEIKETEVHSLYNLALVDKDTNSSLSNSFFDRKREILKQNNLGKYIPICTQRVFSKYYSKSPKEMLFWSDADRKAYFGEIEQMFQSFMKLLGNANGN